MAEKMDAKLDYANQKVEQVIDTNRKLRVGIIGCGWIADAHIDSYKRMPDVELVAGCDLIPGKAAAFFKRNGVEASKPITPPTRRCWMTRACSWMPCPSAPTTVSTPPPPSMR